MPYPVSIPEVSVVHVHPFNGHLVLTFRYKNHLSCRFLLNAYTEISGNPPTKGGLLQGTYQNTCGFKVVNGTQGLKGSSFLGSIL